MKNSIKQMQSSFLGLLSVRFLSNQKLLILLAALFAEVSAHAFSYTYEGQTLNYLKTSDTTCKVTSYKANASNGAYIIPATVANGEAEYTVTEIAENAFKNYSGLISLVIPESVTTIGQSAFYGCTGLETLNIPSGVNTINPSTFYCCSSLTTVEIPESVTTIGAQAFYGCKSLTSFFGKYSTEDHRCLIIDGSLISFAPFGITSYTIPESVRSINNYVFYGCSNLESVTLPESLESIGQFAFEGCSGLTTVEIPNKVYSIGQNAFRGCSSLTNVDIPEFVTSIGWYVFENCINLKSVVIPESVTAIGYSAFAGCSSLSSVVLPESVSTIQRGAFSDCSSLESVVIPEAVKTIEDYTFEGCSKLKSVGIPESVTNIKQSAFKGCSSLESVVIPESVTSIESYVFENCSSLVTVVIPESITSIECSAFGYCNSLKSIVIPESVTSIKECAFQYCSSLESVTISESVNAIGQNAFYSCSNLASVTIPNSLASIESCVFANCYNLKSVEIPESVTSIGFRAFSGCRSLTSLEFPESIESIGNCAFEDCSSLESVVIPESVVTLGGYVFSGCSRLSCIEIPISIRSIGNYAFDNCSSLEKITVDNPDPDEISLGDNVFFMVDHQHCYLFVPKGSEELYAEADQWKDFVKINYRVLEDGKPYQAEEDAEEPNVDYIRKFGNTKWQALYLPFAMSYDEWSPYANVAELYNIRGYDTDDDGTIDEVRVEFNRIKEGSSIKPNVPYVIKAKEARKVTFECKDKVVLAAPEEEGVVECSSTKFTYAFHGIYEEKIDVFDTGVYFLSGGNFVQAADETVKLAPYRAYLTITQKKGGYNDDSTPAPAPKRVVLVVDGEEGTTGIDDIQITAPQDDIYYDLTGRRVTNPTSGIYIQNGRKVYIK